MKYSILGLCLLFLASMVFATDKEDVFGPIPTKPLLSPVALSDNFFIIGASAQSGNYTLESARMFKKYGGAVVWNGHIENFTDTTFFENMKKEKVPTLNQCWGASFVNYLKERDALDYTWGDLNLNKKVTDPDSHLLSMSNPATIDLWKEYIKCGIYNGSNGYVFCDQVSPWAFGRGSGGCNPVTIAQFRQDLEGRDKGFVCNIDGENKTIKFADYAEYYLGFVPEPKSLGLSSWYDYYPTRKAKYDPEGYEKYIIDGEHPVEFYFNIDKETKSDFIPEFLLRDMLIHYEYLKFCDALGKEASSLGGVYFPMPNTEDMANGSDLFFLSSLVSIQGNMEEFFPCPVFNDVAYTRLDYLTRNLRNIRGKRFGVVLESGGGGNACPYYEHFVDFMVAYESTLVNRANMLEGDFWPGLHADLDPNYPLEEYKKDVAIGERMKTILSYANGFKYANEDKGEKLKSSFTTVISRRIFRPWGKEYKTYTYFFGDPNKEIQPDEVLYNSGYVFDTVGFEDAENLSGEMVIWTANTPTVKKFDTFLRRMKEGFINTGMLVAEGLDTVMDSNMNVVSLQDYFPEFARELTKADDESVIKVKCRGEEFSIAGNYYKMPQCKVAMVSEEGTPLLYSMKIAKADMYILPFNPAIKENEGLAKYVYGIVLNRSSILPQWESVNNSSVAVYRNKKGLTVRLRSNYMDRNWSKIYDDPDPLKQRCEYVIGEPTQAKIRVDKPNTNYFVYNYFEGDPEPVVSDEYGFVTVTSPNKSMSLFFIRGVEDIDLFENLKARREEYNSLLNLEP